jgi:hypothetical protein
MSNKIWIKVFSDPVKGDWRHEYTISREEIVKSEQEEEDFVDIMSFDIKESEVEIDTVYILFRFFENYIDTEYMYYDLDEATKEFYKNIEEYQTIYDEDEYQVIEKSYNKDIRSTIYVKDYNERYEWPDKSNRWILKTINLKDLDDE